MFDPPRGGILHTLLRPIRPREKEVVLVAGVGRACKARVAALEPSELAVGSGSELNRATFLVGKLAHEADARGVWPGMDDGLPIALLLVEARGPRPDRVGVLVEPGGGLGVAGLRLQAQQEQSQDPGGRVFSGHAFPLFRSRSSAQRASSSPGAWRGAGMQTGMYCGSLEVGCARLQYRILV